MNDINELNELQTFINQAVIQPRQLHPVVPQVNPFVRFRPVLQQIRQINEAVSFKTGAELRDIIRNYDMALDN
jgi:hypothetical protein